MMTSTPMGPATNAWTTLLTSAGSDAPAAPAADSAVVTKEEATAPAADSAPAMQRGRRSAKKRTDIHRPGAIVPSDYAYLTSYSLAGMNEPAINMDVARAMWGEGKWSKDGGKIEGLSGKKFGALGCCGVCGASFRHGDIWRHLPTGDLVALGHECAEKYELFADREDWCAQLEAQKKHRAALVEQLRRDAAYAAYVERHDGLGEALALGSEPEKPYVCPHEVSCTGNREDGCPPERRVRAPRPSREENARAILADMKQKIRRWGSISDKQIAFALRLADEIQNPKPVVEEKLVAAPVGEARQTIRGVLVSKKTHESAYGESIKMTVKVSTPDGNWLAWGSMPSGLFSCGQDEDGRYYHAEPGDTVEFAAILKPGREPHFALINRPTKARLIARKDSGK